MQLAHVMRYFLSYVSFHLLCCVGVSCISYKHIIEVCVICMRIHLTLKFKAYTSYSVGAIRI